MLSSPTFIDKSGFFASRNVGSVFHAMNEALHLVERKLGESLYLELRELSDQMRQHSKPIRTTKPAIPAKVRH